MPFDLTDCQFVGPALSEPFVRFELEKELNKLKLLPKATGSDGKELKQAWEVYRRHLAQLAVRGGPVRVRNQAVEPLVGRLGYDELQQAKPVETREGREAGGHVFVGNDGSAKVRVWITSFDEDLDAPAKRGQAYRFSHLRIAQRVLLASGERMGLLTNGVELRLLISDPARPDSQVIIPIDPGWKRSRDVPDSFRLLLALASPDGVKAVPELVDKARLQQVRVTKELRQQARNAIGRFVQEVLDHPDNQDWFAEQTNHDQLARDLWHEGLVTVYRLLFVLKLESSDDPARSFAFTSTSLWRNTFSPSMALAPFAPRVLHEGAETGGLVEGGLRTLFKMFEEGIECTELNVKPLGGALFGRAATPVLSKLRWGERAVAHLLDQLLWTTPKRKGGARERVHYGPLDVEDLGRVYEALLELEPGISGEPMCRLRRQKLEVVAPVAQGENYRPEDGVGKAKKSGKTKVEWIEEIPAGRFYLRVGLGRKASGSYYTPHSFVRFLVQETLGPQVAERSPHDDPKPGEILKLKVLDPAMGSGHFLVEACRFLGHHLYEAARLCDEQALQLERQAERAKLKDEREKLLVEAREYRQRVIDLPDPDDEIVRYLPSRSVEGEETGISQSKAKALCRRMVAVHCLYGVDKNPLAVELAKLALWLESHAEGMPLTFLDHRLVAGDSLTGPFWDKLIMRPSNPKEPLEGIFHRGLTLALQNKLAEALSTVRHLEATVGVSVSEIEEKERLKAELDQALRPFRILAAAWSGGVMLGPEKCDDLAYADLLKSVAETGEIPERIESEQLRATIACGLGIAGEACERDTVYERLASSPCAPNLPYDLSFPEVFCPSGVPHGQRGFDAVLGNPPWDAVRPKAKEFFASFDFDILAAPTKRERTATENRLKTDPKVASLHDEYESEFASQHRIHDVLFSHQIVLLAGEKTGGDPDLAKLFMERSRRLLHRGGLVGLVVPSGFHANEGATGIRWLFLDRMVLQCCYSFENRRRLFEIHSSFKFALVVAQADGMTEEFSCAFYLHDDEWLFGERDGREPLLYSREFIRRTSGECMSFLELRSRFDLEVVETCFARGEPFGDVRDALGVHLGRESHMTDDAWRFSPTVDVFRDHSDPRDPEVATIAIGKDYLVLHEGKTFWQYSDHWEARPRYLVAMSSLADKRAWCRSARYFRLAFRDTASSTNERTAIFCYCPPGCLYGNKAPCERKPHESANHTALLVLAVGNSYAFDFLLRQRVQATLNFFIVDATPFPRWPEWQVFAVHTGLRLTCNHSGYEPLWREQVGDAWREEGKEPFTWPVLAGDDERWEVRAAIDAVVADAYGLSRDQYEHVLSTFSHKSYPKAPILCLAKFEELKKLGLAAFTRKHDPYHDIPLNENLPQPVIDLPMPEAKKGEQGKLF